MSTSPGGFSAAKNVSGAPAQLASWRKDFAGHWGSDQPPRIEKYLEQASPGDAERVLRALLETELKLRLRDKETPRASEYVSRFPAHEAVVREVFSRLKQRLAGDGHDRAGMATVTESFVQSGVTTTGEFIPRASAEPIPERIDRFEIISVLGHGGFGTVYRARDPKLSRDVAIKVPRLSRQGGQEEAARLVREAQSAATLSHPSICPIYEIGQQGGQPFIVMALIEGRPLSEFIARQADIKPRQAAAVVLKLARALGEAHAKGIIHRDIKPANIMIDRRGQPIVMDFGLARRVSAGEPCLTREGVVLGTPAYMAPEQARGDKAAVGPASDVFAVGLVLYELLTGRRAFVGTPAAVVEQIQHVEPRRPSELRADIDPKLEAICLKALAKNPAHRYRSMKALAEDLTEYLADQRSTTSATTAVDEEAVTQKFAAMLKAITSETADLRSWRRNWLPAVASLAGAMIVGVILLLGIIFFARTPTATVMINIDVDVRDASLTFFLDGDEIPGDALARPIELKVGKHELVVEKDHRLFRRYTFEVASDGAPALHLAEQEEKPERELPPKPQPELATETPQKEPSSEPAPQFKSSEREEAASAEGVKFSNLLPSRSARMLGDGTLCYWCGAGSYAAFSADGKQLVALTSTCVAHTWDAATGRLIGLAKGVGLPKALSPSGRLAVSQEAGKLLVWRVDTGETVVRINERPEACAAISPDDRQVLAAYADGRMEVVSLDADKQARVVREVGPAGAAVAYSPSGRLVAMIDRRGGQSLFDTTKWRVLHKLSDKSDIPGEVRRIAFSDSLNRLAFSGPQGIEVWDTKDGRRISQITSPKPEGIAVSPDGRLLGVGFDTGRISLLSVDRGALLGQVQSKSDWPFALCFRRDGRQLAGVGYRSIMVCDPYRHRILVEPTVGFPVYSLRFSPDGQILFAGGGGVLSWQLASDRWTRLPEITYPHIRLLAVSGDGKRLIYQEHDRVVASDPRTGRTLDSWKAGYNVTQIAANEQGTLVAAVAENRRIILWNFQTHAMVRAPWAMEQDVLAVSLNASGSRLAVATAGGMALVFDAASGTRTHAFDRTEHCIALSRDGRVLAARGKQQRGAVLRWNLETGEQLPPLGHAAIQIAFSEDGRRIAVKEADECVGIFDAVTGNQILSVVVGPRLPWGLVASMAFSPDGQSIAVGNQNGTVYLFSLAERDGPSETEQGTGKATLRPATLETRPTKARK